MEIALGIGHGQVHRNLVPEQGEHLGRAVDLDILGQLHLLGDGLGARSRSEDGGAKENEFDVAAADEALYTLLKNNKSAEFNNVECVLTNTSIYKCIVFWWIDDLGRQHGLVVRQDDARAIAFAREKLKNRAQNLM